MHSYDVQSLACGLWLGPCVNQVTLVDRHAKLLGPTLANGNCRYLSTISCYEQDGACGARVVHNLSDISRHRNEFRNYYVSPRLVKLRTFSGGKFMRLFATMWL